jgi:hypothetical protein
VVPREERLEFGVGHLAKEDGRWLHRGILINAERRTPNAERRPPTAERRTPTADRAKRESPPKPDAKEQAKADRPVTLVR